MESSFSSSIRADTKAKFDSLLKAALLKKNEKSKSNERLTTASESSRESVQEDGIVEVDVYEDSLGVENKQYILEKFLKDSSHEQEELSEKFVKPPVPKPRVSKLKLQEVSPARTYTASKKLSTNEDDSLNEIASIGKSEEFNTDNKDQINITYEDETKPIPKKRSNVKLANEEKPFDYTHVINVVIHKADRLLIDSFVIHPVVKIHLVDCTDGRYIRKSDKERKVLFYYEDLNIDYVGPVMTRTFNLQENRSLHPNWEESILINDDYTFITKNQFLFMFEIIDFLTPNIINQTNQKDNSGWYKIAWAFLKLTGEGFNNSNKRLRLQLYYPQKTSKQISPDHCDIFQWWQKKKLQPYPSTLHVTIQSILSPSKVIETFRSKSVHEVELGKTVKSTSEATLDGGASSIERPSLQQYICKMPTSCIAKLDGEDEGCFVLKFSNSGQFLAYTVIDNNIHMIVVYEVISNKEVARLPGHQGLIYDIKWSKGDKMIISASADCTICLWNGSTFKFLEMLPHPTFVYCADARESMVASGCYDHFLRIWNVSSDGKYELSDELSGHKGYITSLQLNNDGLVLYTADSVGVVIIWMYNEQWSSKREIKLLDLKNIIINQILLHKRGKRILVNSRDDKLRIIDVKTGYVIQTYNKYSNSRFHITCSFSPCGNFIISGNESGDILIWNVNNGALEHKLKPYKLDITVHCVQFHPKEHLIAVSHYGISVPVLIFECKQEVKITSKKSANVTKKLYNENVKTVASNIEYNPGINFQNILEKIDNIILLK